MHHEDVDMIAATRRRLFATANDFGRWFVQFVNETQASRAEDRQTQRDQWE
jgi:hypothetical protein